jgi:hypothetical protein
VKAAAADGDDLAGASQAALDGSTVPETDGKPGEQLAAIPACQVKFLGMSYDSLDDVPGLKEEVTFIVTGRVVGHEEKVGKTDGNVRTIVKVDATDVRPYNG